MRFDSGMDSPIPHNDPGPDERRAAYMDADPEMYRGEPRSVVTEARQSMVNVDAVLRLLPYEQRTAILLNLLVSYAGEQPAALEARGKFINGLCEEFRTRLQRYLPLKV